METIVQSHAILLGSMLTDFPKSSHSFILTSLSSPLRGLLKRLGKNLNRIVFLKHQVFDIKSLLHQRIKEKGLEMARKKMKIPNIINDLTSN